MAINIQEILHPSDSDSIKFEKINYNFDQILANGGGPAGPKGQKGDQGQVGSTGQKGQKGEVGPIGEKGVAGSTDSPWHKVAVDSNNDGNNEVSILKPKRGTDLNLPVIWLGDPDFEEGVTDGDIDTNARLTIAKDEIFENFLKLYHSANKRLVITSTDVDGYTKFNWQNDFGSTLIEYGITTDKITLVANTSTFGISGHAINLTSLGNTNIKLTTLGSGILDVDINAEFKGYLRLPAGPTGARPSVPQVGMIRFNTDLDVVEAYYANSGSPEWRELCTDCGTPVADSIGITGGDIDANADGSPTSNTISISGGDINANGDGSPVSGASLSINGSNSLTAPYNIPTTLYLNYAITPSTSDPSQSNISVNQSGLTLTVEPGSNRIKVVTPSGTLGSVYNVTVTHPDDSNVSVVWTITLISNSPTPTPTSSSGAGPTPTPTSSSGAGPTPTPTSSSGAGPTPTPTSGSGAGPTPTPTSSSGAGPTPTPTCPEIISVNTLEANPTSASNSYTSIGGWCRQTFEDTEGEVWFFNPSAVNTPEIYYYAFAGGAGTACEWGSNLNNTIQGTEYTWAGGVLTPTTGTELWITPRTWTSGGQSYQVVIETSGNGIAFDIVHFVPIC